MIVVTTNELEGKRIVKYISIVTGEAIIGANIVKDFFAGIRDIVGGRSGSYEDVITLLAFKKLTGLLLHNRSANVSP